MATYGKARGIGRAAGSAIGKLAVKVYECNGCGGHYHGERPQQCRACGRLDFTKIDSRAEAARIGTLRMLEKRGAISDLRTQVRFPLMAYRAGVPVKVGDYIADAVYFRDGRQIIEDVKGGAMTDVAALKLRFMAAMGLPVNIVKG
jgi:rubredoxin